MSGENNITCNAVMADDRFDLARIWDTQQDEVDPEVD